MNAGLASSTPKIILVRHGRSGHVQSGWMTRAGFLAWREAYEAAGVDAADVPPSSLRTAAEASAVLASSSARRASDSARALAPGREVLVSPLLNELELLPPQLGNIRLPLPGWALTFMLRWLSGNLETPREKERVRVAAAWLRELALSHGSVVAVTHASFRAALARELVRNGWRCDVPKRRSAHWSAWSFESR